MATRPQHRPTPTQRLRADIARLEAEKAELIKQADVVDGTVYEQRFLIPGHIDGAAAYIAIRRHGDAWAVLDNNNGHRGQSWWDGRLWWADSPTLPPNTVHRFTHDHAERQARQFAADAAERHHRNALLAQARRIEEHANEGLNRHAERVSA